MTLKFKVGRVVVELDASDSYTPVMLTIGREHATWACAMDTGYVNDDPITPREMEELLGMEPEIEVFMNAVKEK